MPVITTTQIDTAIVQPFSRILLELGLPEGATFFQRAGK